jgi:hypothetical protein
MNHDELKKYKRKAKAQRGNWKKKALAAEQRVEELKTILTEARDEIYRLQSRETVMQKTQALKLN